MPEKRFAAFVAATIVSLPFLCGASLTASGSTANACTSGSATSGANGGAIGAGSAQTSDVITVYDSKVTVRCEKLQPGETAYVTYCGLSNGCHTFPKDSTQGDNLESLVGEVTAGGVPSGNQYSINTQDLVERFLTPDQLQTAQTEIIGKPSSYGSNYDYGNIVNTIGNFSSDPESPSASLQDASKSAISVISSMAAEANPPLEPPASQLSFMYEASQVGDLNQKILTDAYPVEAQDSSYVSPTEHYVPVDTSQPSTFGSPALQGTPASPALPAVPASSNSEGQASPVGTPMQSPAGSPTLPGNAPQENLSANSENTTFQSSLVSYIDPFPSWVNSIFYPTSPSQGAPSSDIWQNVDQNITNGWVTFLRALGL